MLESWLMCLKSWYKDKASKFDDASNSGFEKRSELIKDSQKFELMGSLFLNFYRQGQYLLSQTNAFEAHTQ